MFLRQNSGNVMCCMDMMVLWGNVGSGSNFCFTILMEGSTGTEVKRVLTSHDVITSPGPYFTFDKGMTREYRYTSKGPTL